VFTGEKREAREILTLSKPVRPKEVLPMCPNSLQALEIVSGDEQPMLGIDPC